MLREFVAGSPTTPPLPDNKEPTSAVPTRTKQENALHLTCVASGYAKYSPYNERKEYENDSATQSPLASTSNLNSLDTSSNHKLNGAITTVTTSTPSLNDTKPASLEDELEPSQSAGDQTPSFHVVVASPHTANGISPHISSTEEETTPQLNGRADIHTDNNGHNNLGELNPLTDDCSHTVSSDAIIVAILNGDIEQTTSNNTGQSDSGPSPTTTAVDKSVLVLDLHTDLVASKQPAVVTKLSNGVSGSIHDSPSKKVKLTSQRGYEGEGKRGKLVCCLAVIHFAHIVAVFLV